MALLAETYTTIQGETWDEIARKVYGDEKYAALLMADNYPLLDILVFPAGTVLSTPVQPEYTEEEMPPWRTGNDDVENEDDPYDDYDDEEDGI